MYTHAHTQLEERCFSHKHRVSVGLVGRLLVNFKYKFIPLLTQLAVDMAYLWLVNTAPS